jgi:hypothetical protein
VCRGLRVGLRCYRLYFRRGTSEILVLDDDRDIVQSDSGPIQDVLHGCPVVSAVVLVPGYSLLFDCENNFPVCEQANGAIMRESGTEYKYGRGSHVRFCNICCYEGQLFT